MERRIAELERVARERGEDADWLRYMTDEELDVLLVAIGYSMGAGEDAALAEFGDMLKRVSMNVYARMKAEREKEK